MKISADMGRCRPSTQLTVPLVLLATGNAIFVQDYEREAHPQAVKSFFSHADLERRAAARTVRRDLMGVETDRRVAGWPNGSPHRQAHSLLEHKPFSAGPVICAVSPAPAD